MANKKKIATSVVAVATATALLLGGTFAWQSISQTALNEASDIVNPGGRLHDDFNGENKDVYVENFAEEPIFARVRLDEYFEITINKGMGEGIERTLEVIGSREKLPDGSLDYDDEGNIQYNYDTFKDYESGGTFDAANERDDQENIVKSWWTWTTGGDTVYMPTFNMNKDSLQADVNGTYEGPDDTDGEVEGDDEDRYDDYVTYTEGETKIADETYDADSNNIEDEGITTIEDQPHIAKKTETAQLISMEEWLAMNGIEAATAASAAADDPYGVAPAFAENDMAILHYDNNAEVAVGEIADVEMPYGSELTLSAGGFSREGYTLVGWNTQADGNGTTYALGATFTLPEGETTLYAVWELDDGTGGGTDDENTQDDEPAYWVYDTDGWVYYSKPIQPNTASGLLLSGIQLNEVMDDSWYYAINVVGQFITADDMGSIEDGTGFYDSEKGAPPSENALKLLDTIGVDVDSSNTGDDTGDEEEEYLVPDADLPRTDFESDDAVPTTTVERGKVYFPSTLYDADGNNIGITTLEITSAGTNHTSYIGYTRIGMPVIAIAADEPNDTLTLVVKTVKDDSENPIIRKVTLSIINPTT